MVLIKQLIFTTMIKTVSRVVVANVKPHAFKSDLNQAELRQKVIRQYAARHLGNDMQSAFAPREAYKLSENTFEKERVCWVDIPQDWDTNHAQSFLDQLYESDGFEPCIYQILSHEPILTSDDHAWMENKSQGEIDAFLAGKRSKQEIIHPETGEIALRNGRALYRRLFYSDKPREDVDLTSERKISAVDAESLEPRQKKEVMTESVQVVEVEDDGFTF
jgi:uncharacterized protein YdaT